MATSDSTVEYREIPNWPGYRIGSDGSVWSCWNRAGRGNGYANRITDQWKSMKLRLCGKGYCTVNLKPGGVEKLKTVRVHRLVLEAFVGPCPENMECRHLNGVRSDCRVENLAWGSRAENIADKKVHANYGRKARLYTHDGQTLLLKEWSRVFSIPYTCLWHRISKLGMTFEEAVARPYLGTTSNGGHWTKKKRSGG